MQLDIELTAREDVPRWLAYGTPVFTVLAALAVSALAFLALNVSPVTAYEAMFVTTLTTELGVTQTINKAAPLILAGLAVYLPLRAQLWNIGAEGQLLIGACAGTWVGLNVSLPAMALIPLMFVVGGLAGAAWTFVPAWLRVRWGINEIITTLLLTFVAVDVKSYLVRGPMQAQFGFFPQTDSLPAEATLPTLFGFDFYAGILAAVAFVALTYLLINETRFGYQITFIGSNDEAAEQAGMSKLRIYLFVMLAGGALAGLAGITEIAGVQGRLRAEWDPGYGWTAIPIALLGRNGAIQVMLAAVFFAVIFVGGSSVGVALSVPAAIIDVIQALIILFLITAEFFKRYHVDFSIRRKPDPGTAPTPEGEV